MVRCSPDSRPVWTVVEFEGLDSAILLTGTLVASSFSFFWSSSTSIVVTPAAFSSGERSLLMWVKVVLVGRVSSLSKAIKSASSFSVSRSSSSSRKLSSSSLSVSSSSASLFSLSFYYASEEVNVSSSAEGFSSSEASLESQALIPEFSYKPY